MANSSSRDRTMSLLRSMGPGYRLVRAGYRLSRKGAAELFRALIPRGMPAGLPKGLFSLLEQVRSGAVPGGIFFEQQEVPEFSSDSLVKRCGLRQDEFQPWPVFWAKVDHARLFGRNLVLLNDRKEACREFMFAPHCPATDESYQIPTFQRPVFLPGKWSTLVSRWDGQDGYWHFLMDALPRLHALPQFPPEIGILIRGPIAEWQWELLRLLGVAERVRPTTEKHLMVEELYFASHTSMTGAWNAVAVTFLREKFLTEFGVQSSGFRVKNHCRFASFGNTKSTFDLRLRSVENGSVKKIFIARGSCWTRGIRNQDEVIGFFEERGWTVLEPEKLGVADQIRVFSQADAVCGAHGSALTNLLWMKPGARVIELLADNFMLGAFEWLARCVGLKHDFLIFPGDHRLSFEVDLGRLEEVVSCDL